MPDQDGGKLARVVTHEGTSEIWVELLRIGWFTSESDAIATCDLLNSHVSRLLTAERKRVLEMVFDLDGFKPTLHEMFGVAHDNPEMAEAYQRVGKVADGIRGQLKIEIRALLSRLEGEEER